MKSRTVDAKTHVANTPQEVIKFLSDVRNRQKHFPALKGVTDVKGEPDKAQQTWKYTFSALGREFAGTAHATKYEAGKLYAFQTKGDAESTWTYRAEPDGDGTKLTLRVEYSIPDDVLANLPKDKDPGALEQAEAAKLFQNLNKVLNK